MDKNRWGERIMGVEYELKYAADPRVQAMIRQAFPGPWQELSMRTTYYDTPEQTLANMHCTLRRRLENGKSVCTLKTPAGGWGRGEWETEAEHVEDALPKLCKLGGPEEILHLAMKGVETVCGACFTRYACTVNTGTAVVELALDRGELFAGDKRIPLCEVEVELKAGIPEEAVAFARVLAKTYHLKPEPRSKFSRAFALRKEKENV